MSTLSNVNFKNFALQAGEPESLHTSRKDHFYYRNDPFLMNNQTLTYRLAQA